MKTEQVNQLMRKLAWNNLQSDIDSTIDNLINIDDEKISMLILPDFDKGLWENAALVLKRIGYPRIQHVIPELLGWLKDINWPGVNTIIELLRTVDTKSLVLHVEKVLIKAKDENDDLWIGGIKILLKQTKIRKEDFSNKGIYDILDSIDWC